MKIHYTLAELEDMPTLSLGQTDDLKAENEDTRIWLSRLSTEDGEPYNNKVTIERLEEDFRENRLSSQWVTKETYEAK